MATLLIVARIGLALVFTVAAVGKLTDRQGTARAAADLGVPPRMAPHVARVLPFAELAAAAVLLPGSTARFGGALAVLLLAAFTVVVARTLAGGQKPDCNCFGQLSATPIGWTTVARNAVLLAVAVAVTVEGGPAVGSWASSTASSNAGSRFILALVATVIGEALLLAYLAGRRARVAEAPPTAEGARDAGLPVGVPAPAFDLADVDGGRSTLADVTADGRQAILIFTSPTCVPCSELLPDVARWQAAYASTLSVVPIGSGTLEANRDKAEQHGLTRLLHDGGADIASGYRYVGTPAAVLVDREGRIASDLASGPAAIRRLADDVIAGLGATGAMPLGELVVGEPAPPFILASLHQHPVSLSDYGGSLVLLVFWDSSCGYCHSLLPELRQWEAESPEGAHLLLVAIGSEEGLRAQGWRSHVVLDTGSLVTRSYGGFGTPTAVLVDAAGRVASDLAVGAEDVLALADRASALARLAASFSSS